MKTKQLMMTALILGTSVLAAQTEKKSTTVRIKKVENINGVEKVTDTAYTTSDPSIIKMDDGNIEINEMNDGKGMKKTIIMNIDNAGSGKQLTDKELEQKMEQIEFDPKMLEGKTFVIKKVGKCDATKEEIDNANEVINITVIKKIEIRDANDEEMKMLGKQTGVGDNKLETDKMNLSPNPSNGKFDLNFNLRSKGDTEVSVFDMQGKQVYNEKLSGFEGEYKKSIDLSNNNKGIYFVKIQQGSHTQVKKVVVE